MAKPDTDIKELGFGTGHTLPATLHKNLVRFKLLPSPRLAVLLAREDDFDAILLLETNDVLATLTNQPGVILVRDLQDLLCLIREPVDLGENPLLGLLNVLLTSRDLDVRLLVNDFLLLANDLLLVVWIVTEVDLDAKGVPQLVYSSALRTDDPTHILTVDVELSGVATDDSVVLGILDDLEDLLDSTIDICACTADQDHVLSRGITDLSADLHGKRLVLADDSIQRSPILAYHSVMPFLLNRDCLRLHIRRVLRHLQQFLLHVLEILGFLDRGRGSGGRRRIVHQQDQ